MVLILKYNTKSIYLKNNQLEISTEEKRIIFGNFGHILISLFKREFYYY